MKKVALEKQKEEALFRVLQENKKLKQINDEIPLKQSFGSGKIGKELQKEINPSFLTLWNQ